LKLILRRHPELAKDLAHSELVVDYCD
jgi:hypothetical protein